MLLLAIRMLLVTAILKVDGISLQDCSSRQWRGCARALVRRGELRVAFLNLEAFLGADIAMEVEDISGRPPSLLIQTGGTLVENCKASTYELRPPHKYLFLCKVPFASHTTISFSLQFVVAALTTPPPFPLLSRTIQTAIGKLNRPYWCPAPA